MVSAGTDVFSPRRRHPRKFHSARAVVFNGDSSDLSRTIQISEGGLLISTGLDLEIGAPVTVHFMIPNAYVRVKCEVIYVLGDQSEAGRHKVGLRYNSISEFDRELIRAFTSRI